MAIENSRILLDMLGELKTWLVTIMDMPAIVIALQNYEESGDYEGVLVHRVATLFCFYFINQ